MHIYLTATISEDNMNNILVCPSLWLPLTFEVVLMPIIPSVTGARRRSGARCHHRLTSSHAFWQAGRECIWLFTMWSRRFIDATPILTQWDRVFEGVATKHPDTDCGVL
jgi:hypothetical protein